jgi:hypothetical protein
MRKTTLERFFGHLGEPVLEDQSEQAITNVLERLRSEDESKSMHVISLPKDVRHKASADLDHRCRCRGIDDHRSVSARGFVACRCAQNGGWSRAGALGDRIGTAFFGPVKTADC